MRVSFWGIVFVISIIALVYYLFFYYGKGKNYLNFTKPTSIALSQNTGQVQSSGLQEQVIKKQEIQTGILQEIVDVKISTGKKESIKNLPKIVKLTSTDILKGECGQPVELVDFFNVIFSGLVFTGQICYTGNTIFFESEDFSCLLAQKHMRERNFNLFVDTEFLRKNKLVGQEVCFLNVPGFDNVFWGFLKNDKWYWFITPKEDYYKIKLRLWKLYKDK